MEIRNYFVCRVAGLPISAIQQLGSERCLLQFEAIDALERCLLQTREDVSQRLYEAIGASDNRPIRNQLLKLRRDLFNLRVVSPKTMDVVLGVVSADLRPTIRQFNTTVADYHRAIDQFTSVYNCAVDQTRHQFQQAISDPDFQKGIMLASDSLSHSLDKYTTQNHPTHLRKREAKVERSLLRYWTRMATKTTPFGTFCTVINGSFVTTNDGVGFTASPAEKRSFIRLNKSLYGAIVTYLQKSAGIREFLHVELNPTLHQETGQFIFLSAVDGNEVFQRVPANAVLGLIANLFRQQVSQPLHCLIETLCRHPQIEASLAEATAYINKLVAIGFVRFRTGIREQEADWDRPLINILECIDHPVTAQISTLLRQLRVISTQYATASLTERSPLIGQSRKLVKETFTALGIALPDTKVPFYEDCSAQSELVVPRESYRLAIEHLQTFTALLRTIGWPRGEQITMRHFFEQTYGREKSIPLLQFYETFYREHFKAHLERERDQQRGQKQEGDHYDLRNPFKQPLIDQIMAAQNKLTQRLTALWQANPTAVQIDVTHADFADALADVPPVSVNASSLSVFVQLIPALDATGDPAFVMPNGSQSLGFGKYFSRFLYMFPQEVQEQIVTDNVALTDDYVAEICGDAGFNANLHPPLLDWEISYPTGESGSAESQIRTADLMVACDPENPHTLALFVRDSGKRVIPVDLGFLNPRMRPPLYQLLSRFTRPANQTLVLPKTLSGKRSEAEDPEISYRPRIVYEGALVLGRRQWSMPTACFPMVRPQEQADAYFLRVNRWRKAQGIPETVFMRVRNQGYFSNSKRKRKPNGAHSRDMYKPQFIDFRAPLLVELFGRTGFGLEKFTVTLEECLPDHTHHISHDGEQFATELIVQLNQADERVYAAGR